MGRGPGQVQRSPAESVNEKQPAEGRERGQRRIRNGDGERVEVAQRLDEEGAVMAREEIAGRLEEEIETADDERPFEIDSRHQVSPPALVVLFVERLSHDFYFSLSGDLAPFTPKVFQGPQRFFVPAFHEQPARRFGDEPHQRRDDGRDHVVQPVGDFPRGVGRDLARSATNAVDDDATEAETELVAAHRKATDGGGRDLGLIHRHRRQLHANVDIVEDAAHQHLRPAVAGAGGDYDGRGAHSPERHEEDGHPTPVA